MRTFHAAKMSSYMRGIWRRSLEFDAGSSVDRLDLLRQLSNEKLGEVASVDVASLVAVNTIVDDVVVVRHGQFCGVLLPKWPENYDLTHSKLWREQVHSNGWLPPAFIVQQQLEDWNAALLSGARQGAELERVGQAHFSRTALLTFICEMYRCSGMVEYADSCLEAVECHWLGRNRAAVAILIPIVEAAIRRLAKVVGFEGTPVRDASDQALRRGFERFSGSRYHVTMHGGIHRVDWLPDCFTTLDFSARVDWIALQFCLLREYLIQYFYADTRLGGARACSPVNRNDFAHGISPVKATNVDVFKLVGLIRSLVQAFGFLVNHESCFPYGWSHGAVESNAGFVIDEPDEPVAALDSYRRVLLRARASIEHASHDVVGPLRNVVSASGRLREAMVCRENDGAQRSTE